MDADEMIDIVEMCEYIPLHITPQEEKEWEQFHACHVVLRDSIFRMFGLSEHLILGE